MEVESRHLLLMRPLLLLPLPRRRRAQALAVVAGGAGIILPLRVAAAMDNQGAIRRVSAVAAAAVLESRCSSSSSEGRRRRRRTVDAGAGGMAYFSAQRCKSCTHAPRRQGQIITAKRPWLLPTRRTLCRTGGAAGVAIQLLNKHAPKKAPHSHNTSTQAHTHMHTSTTAQPTACTQYHSPFSGCSSRRPRWWGPALFQTHLTRPHVCHVSNTPDTPRLSRCTPSPIDTYAQLTLKMKRYHYIHTRT